MALVVDALGFPGQGVDPVATVTVLVEHCDHPLAQLVAEVTEGVELNAAALTDTRIAQPCVVAAGLIAAEGRSAELLLGHSLGEITACAQAEVITAEAAVRLVALRAQIGTRAVIDRPGMMVAIMRLDLATVEWIRRLAVGRTGGLLDVAVVNSDRQTVLTGDRAAATMAVDLAFEAGGKGRRLGIGGAFHSPLLAPAIAEFEDAIAACAPAAPSVPVVCSTGPILTDATEIAPALAASLVRPVHWPDAVRRAVDLGVSRVLDAGPGETLANLAGHFASPPTLPLAAVDPSLG